MMKVVNLAIKYTLEEEEWVEKVGSQTLRAEILRKDAPNFYSLSREVNLIPWHISNAVRTLR